MKPKSSVDRGHEPARVCAKIERKRTIDVRGWKTAKSCENALASWPFYSFVQPCNELLAETITARRTIRCVLVVSKHTGWPLSPHTTKTVWTIRPYRGTLVDGHGSYALRKIFPVFGLR